MELVWFLFNLIYALAGGVVGLAGQLLAAIFRMIDHIQHPDEG